METRSSPLTVTILALVMTLVPGAMFLSPQRGGNAESSQRSTASSEPGKVAPGQPVTATNLIEQFLGRSLSPSDTARAPIVRAMIVDLPDPIDAPNLDWRYDAGMIAVRRAAESGRYVVDRFWLPWTADGDLKKHNADTLLRRRSNAGVLLFRSVDRVISNGKQRDVLFVVFIVGETPNGGVSKGALGDAIRQIAQLRKTCAVEENTTLRMVAPYFTGSAPSIRLALNTLPDTSPFKQIKMITGSATGESIRNELASITGRAVSLDATVNSDFDLQRVLVDVITKRLGFASEEVALLQESSTAYGQGGPGVGSTLEPPPEFRASDSVVRTFTVIPFPMHIASLRDQQEPSSGGASSSQGAQRAAPVSISLREPGTNVDRPPSVSALTPAVVSLAVEAISDAFRERHFRVVGIMATDVRDKLFLAREVRRHLPDVQLFTTESNLLYLWPEYTDALHGMLVATTYPLLLETQAWNRPEPADRMLSFTEEASAGVFNAVLRHLGAPTDRLIDYGIPGSSDTLRRPPIWLLGVGRHGFVPMFLDTSAAREKPWVATVVDTSRASIAHPSRDVKQAGEARVAAAPPVARLARETHPGRETAMWIVLIAGAILIGGRLFEMSQTRDEYVVIECEPDASRIPFRQLRRQIVLRSLLLHQQLYTMIRDLSVGSGVVVVAIVLLATAQSDAFGNKTGFEIMPWLLGLLVGATVVFSLFWVVFVAWRMRNYGTEFALMRNWFTERRRGDHDQEHEARIERRKNAGLGDRRLTPRGARWSHTLWLFEIVARLGTVVVAGLFAFLVIMMMRQAASPIAPSFDTLANKLFFHRAAQLSSGLSPIVPLLIGVMGFAAWTTWHLSRIELLKQPVPFEAFAEVEPDGDQAIGTVARSMRRCALQIRERLFLVVPDGLGLVILAVLLLLGWAIALQFNFTLESITLAPLAFRRNAFDLLLAFCVLSALGSTAWGLYRFWVVWGWLKRFLDEISASPMLTAFERVPKRVSHLSQLTLRQASTRDALEGVSATQWQHLVALHRAGKRAIDGLPDPVRTRVQELMDAAPPPERCEQPFDTGREDRLNEIRRELEIEKREARRHRELERLSKQRPLTPAEAKELEHDIDAARIARRAKIEERKEDREVEVARRLRLLFRAINAFWQHEPQHPQLGSVVSSAAASSTSSTSGSIRRLVNDPARLWLRAAEETAAVQVVAYIEWVLQHLRVLALFLLIGLLLGTGLLSSYPFQPQTGIKLLFVILLLATVGSILTVGTQMNRDEVISRVTRSDPGKITWSASYVINIVIFGLLPILTYIGSGVAPIREGVASWFEPLARTLSQH